MSIRRIDSYDVLKDGMRKHIEGERRRNNPARYIQERIAALIADFEDTVGPDFEIGISLPGATGDAIHLRSISSSNPDLILFKGVDLDGRPAQIIQHHSQTNLVLVALPKREQTPYRIGFVDLGEKAQSD